MRSKGDIMDLKLGQKITVIIYRGTSKVEAEAVYSHLQNAYKGKEPIPLNGTDFYILVAGAKKEEFSDSPMIPFTQKKNYQITLKGEIVDGKKIKS